MLGHHTAVGQCGMMSKAAGRSRCSLSMMAGSKAHGGFTRTTSCCQSSANPSRASAVGSSSRDAYQATTLVW